MWNRLNDNLLLDRGEGLDTVLVHTWPWPPWFSLLLLLSLALLIIFLYFREPGDRRRGTRLFLAGIRVSLVCLILMMMYGWMRDRYRTDLPDLALVLDDSTSMAEVDQYESEALTDPFQKGLQQLELEEMSRINLAKLLLIGEPTNWLARLSQRYNLKLYLISSSTRALHRHHEIAPEAILPLEADQPASRLGQGIRAVLEMQRGRPTAAIVGLTDGITTEGQSIADVADEARLRNTPLFLVGLGDDQPARDVRVEDVLLDEAVFLGDLIRCDFRLIGEGFDTSDVTVPLRRADNARVLAEQTVPLTGDGQAENVRLACRIFEEGEFDLIIEAEPLPTESNLDNNTQTRTVIVRDEIIRVLLLQEYPSYEFRYLKALLERGLAPDEQRKTIQLTTVLQEADLDYVQLDETARRIFPVGRDELFDFDVLIIGDANPSFLSQPVMENIVAFVTEHGGGLVLLAGPRHMPLSYRGTVLEGLLPIELDTASLPDAEQLITQSFRVAPTRLGLGSSPLQLEETVAASRRVWQQLPPIRWLLQAPDLHPAARVLGEHPTRSGPTGQRLPVICAQFVGAGEVVFHATDESYLWSRFQETDTYYERYWIQTIRRLAQAKLSGASDEVLITTNAARYQRGDMVPIRVLFRDERQAPAADDDVLVVVEHHTGRRREVRLDRDAARRGVFEGAISSLPPGQYRVWLTMPAREKMPAAAHFEVLPPPGERARITMDADNLRQAAQATGGQFYDIASADQLPGDLPPGRQVRIESLPPTPVWNSPFLAGLFVTLIITEWLVRRRVGWL